MKRGEIYDVDIPPYPGEPGTEQHGGRPAIIMAVDSVRANLSNVLVVHSQANWQDSLPRARF